MESWKYYYGAIVPDCVPHKEPNLELIETKALWKKWKKALFIRYTTNFDCGYETNWWYTIKDSPFDASLLKAKRRYEITKGNKFFTVKRIHPVDYIEELTDVQIGAMKGYSGNRIVERESFAKEVASWSTLCHLRMYGAFFNETNRLCGYALVFEQENVLQLSSLKTDVEYEKYAVNAAIVNKILQDSREELENGKYICDGSRNINHDTQFQGYLEKYFGFRRAYCKLNIKYKLGVGFVVKLLYPFRKALQKLDRFSFVHKINAVLKTEEFVKIDQKRKKE